MKLEKYFSILFLILFLLSFNISFASDTMARFINKEQDYLLIGEIIEKKDKLFKIKVSEIIKSSSKKSTIPSIIEITLNSIGFEQGDFIAISIDKKNGTYVEKNGVYLITSNNTDNLKVSALYPEQDKAELAAIEMFLISRGKVKDFYFNLGNAYVYNTLYQSSENDFCIYDKLSGKNIPENIDKNEKYVIKDSEEKYIPYILLLSGIAIILIIIFKGKKMKR